MPADRTPKGAIHASVRALGGERKVFARGVRAAAIVDPRAPCDADELMRHMMATCGRHRAFTSRQATRWRKGAPLWCAARRWSTSSRPRSVRRDGRQCAWASGSRGGGLVDPRTRDGAMDGCSPTGRKTAQWRDAFARALRHERTFGRTRRWPSTSRSSEYAAALSSAFACAVRLNSVPRRRTAPSTRCRHEVPTCVSRDAAWKQMARSARRLAVSRGERIRRSNRGTGSSAAASKRTSESDLLGFGVRTGRRERASRIRFPAHGGRSPRKHA